MRAVRSSTQCSVHHKAAVSRNHRSASGLPSRAVVWGPDMASDKLQEHLQRVVENLHAELDRVELLAAAIGAFSRPVPDYEPVFRHLSPAEYELRRGERRDADRRR